MILWSRPILKKIMEVKKMDIGEIVSDAIKYPSSDIDSIVYYNVGA